MIVYFKARCLEDASNTTMFRKHAILITLIIAWLLMASAMHFYPGGSDIDKHSICYSWRHNYISTLFTAVAVNGAENTGRYWAYAGMLFNSIAFSLFYLVFSGRIPDRHASVVIRYSGVGAMITAFLAAASFHDEMVIVSGTLMMVSILYVMVFLFKAKLYRFGLISAVYLAVLYINAYLYFSRNLLEWLPLMQKLNFLVAIIWMLCLYYFTKAEDFALLKNSEGEKDKES